MDTSDQKEKIQSQLEVIGSLSPGLTLSASTMTVVDHRTWGTAFWRLYARENRQQSVDCIGNILNNALDILKDDPSENLANNIKIALKGFESLKETYSGAQDIIENIESIITYVKNNLTDIGFGFSECIIEREEKNNAESDLREMVEKVVHDIRDENIPEDCVVLDAMNYPEDSSVQKICSCKNNETIIESILERASDLEQMVEVSDRTDCQETVDGTIGDNVEGNITEDSNSVCDGDVVCIDNIQKQQDINCGINSDPAFSKSKQNIILETENTTISNDSLEDHNTENHGDFDSSEKKTTYSRGPIELGPTSNGSLKIMNPMMKKTAYGCTLVFVDKGHEISVEKNITRGRTRKILCIFGSRITRMYSGMIRKGMSSKFLTKTIRINIYYAYCTCFV